VAPVLPERFARRKKLRFASFALVVGLASNAFAQGDGAAAEPAPDPAAAAAPVQQPIPAPAPASSGLTLRNGFSLSVGEEFATVNGTSFSGQLYGVDWRIGAKINSAISAYVHSHLSLGTAAIGGTSGYTGNFAIAAVGEYQLPMRLFVGAGAGYGVLNNPSGPLVELRAGYYPFEFKNAGKARHLNVALDARWYIVENAGSSLTVTHVALSLGYDRF
jgi:hypothetical protein